jgi:hypothetical protein
MRRLVPVLSVLVACRPSADDGAMDDVVDVADTRSETGTGTETDTDTGTETDPTRTVAEACASVCDGYDACGCAERCQSWCDSYLDWSICVTEIEALIACAATHPSPCTWGDELQPDITCASEIQAFSSCSGNSFFPLPGVPEVCDQGP